jgi:hypothetical protein
MLVFVMLVAAAFRIDAVAGQHLLLLDLGWRCCCGPCCCPCHRPSHACHAAAAALQVRLSVVEIYCERIRDLLDPVRDNLQVKQEPGGAIFIEGAQCILVATGLV